MINGFECEILTGDTFTVITSDLPLNGEFDNVTSGDRLDTTDGLGSFLVEYGSGTASPNAVVLREFVADIDYQTFGDWAIANSLPEGQDGLLDDPNGDGILNIEAFLRAGTAGLRRANAHGGRAVWWEC